MQNIVRRRCSLPAAVAKSDKYTISDKKLNDIKIKIIKNFRRSMQSTKNKINIKKLIIKKTQHV